MQSLSCRSSALLVELNETSYFATVFSVTQAAVLAADTVLPGLYPQQAPREGLRARQAHQSLMGQQGNHSCPEHYTGGLVTLSAAQHPLAALDACKLPDGTLGLGFRLWSMQVRHLLVMQLPCRSWASTSLSWLAPAPTTGKPVQAPEPPLLSSASETQHECRLVKTGPYRIVRHPAYTGGAVGYIALAIFLQLPAVMTAGGTAVLAVSLAGITSALARWHSAGHRTWVLSRQKTAIHHGL